MAGANVAMLLVLNLGISLTTVVLTPAEASMIPRIVSKAQLETAMGIFNLTLQASFAVGFAFLGPLLVTIAGPSFVLGVVVVFYAAATIATVRPAVGAADRARAGTCEPAQLPRADRPAARGPRGDQRQPRGQPAAAAPRRIGVARRRHRRPRAEPRPVPRPRPEEPDRRRPAARPRRRGRRASGCAGSAAGSRAGGPAKAGLIAFGLLAIGDLARSARSGRAPGLPVIPIVVVLAFVAGRGLRGDDGLRADGAVREHAGGAFAAASSACSPRSSAPRASCRSSSPGRWRTRSRHRP